MAGSRETPEERAARETSGEPDAAGRTLEWRKAAATKMLRDNPDLSNRAVGQATHLDHKTVAKLRPPRGDSPRGLTFGRRPAEGEIVSLVASAARIQLDDKRAVANTRKRRQGWQSEAWDYFDEVGEVGYTVSFLANLMSKIRLFPACRPDPKGAPVPVDDPESGIDPDLAKRAIATLERMRSLQGGQSALVRDLSSNLEVAGEGYLHGHSDPDTGEEDWRIRSVDELIVTGDTFAIRDGPGTNMSEPLPPDDIVIRLWERHPRFGQLATCAMRRVLSECEALLLLSREIRATSKSRLSNGILLVPSELSFGAVDPTRDLGGGEEEEDPFDAELRESMITPIQEEGSASAVVPLVLRGPAEYLQHVNHLALDRNLDPVLDSRIDQRVLRVARGLNAPVEVTCADEATEILTANGWRRHDEIAEGDEILTLNHDTGLSEWRPIQSVNRFAVSDHLMLSMEGRYHSSLTTFDHRWPVVGGVTGARQWRTSDTLTGTDRLIVSARASDLPAEPKYADSFVALVGWFWTEGCFHGTGGGYLSQSWRANPDKCDEIRATLTELCGPASPMHTASREWKVCRFEGCGWPVHSNGLCNAHRSQNDRGTPLHPARHRRQPPKIKQAMPAWTEQAGQKDSIRFALNKPLVDSLRQVMDDKKVVTVDFLRSLTRSQLELFIDVSIRGDGHRHETAGTMQLHQQVGERTEAFALACVLSGRSVSFSNSVRTGGYRSDFNDRWMVTAGGGERQSSWVRSLRRRQVRYTGTVWCPTVRNASWLARRNGKVFYTGNTGLMATTFANAVQVKQSTFEDHIEPRAVLIVDAFTAGYFQPALAADSPDVDIAQVRDIFVWFDPEALIAKPDQAEQAEMAHKDGVISDEARRRYIGYTEADAPTDEEMLRRILFHATRLDPTVLAQLFVITGLAPELKIPNPPAGILGQECPVAPTTQIGVVPDEPPDARSPNPNENKGAPGKPGGNNKKTDSKTPTPKDEADRTAPSNDPKPQGGTTTATAAGYDQMWAARSEFVQAAMQASVDAKAAPWRKLGFKLTAIDRDLRTKIMTALDRAMRQALDRAGRQILSRVQRDKGGQTSTIRKIAEAGPPSRVAATLSPALVAAATHLTDEQLLAGAFDQVVDDVTGWLHIAYRQAVEEVEKVCGSLSEARRAELDAAHDVNMDRAVQVLVENLAALAAARLYDPTPGAPEVGEHDRTCLIPVSLVRVVMATAGGGRPAGGSSRLVAGSWVDVSTPVTGQDGGPAAGLAGGPDMMGLVSEAGGGVEGWVWEYGAAARRSFPPHEAIDGVEVRNVDDQAWANDSGWPTGQCFPGDHDGCFPAGTVVSGPRAAAATLRDWQGEMVKVGLASGQFLTATPNHPVLTAHGWVALGDLGEGDEIVRCVDGEAITGLVPNDYQMPAPIEEVADTFGVYGQVGSRRVEVAAENFHGDGRGSQVAVVGADRGLWNRLNATLGKPASELSFPVADPMVGAGHASLGGLASSSEIVGPPAFRFESVGGHLPSSFRGPRSEGELLCFADRTNPDASFSQTFGDGDTVDADRLGQSLDGLARFVTADKVINVERYAFHGPVYNLDTRVGWYVADGIIARNCLCDITPIILSPESSAAIASDEGGDPMAVFGDNFQVYGVADDLVNENVSMLSQLDPAFTDSMAARDWQVIVGPGGVGDLPGFEDFNGVAVNPGDSRLWNTVGGVADSTGRMVGIGTTQTAPGMFYASPPSLHEMGHAIDVTTQPKGAMRASLRAGWGDIYNQAVADGNLAPYFLQADRLGRRELFAEAFGVYSWDGATAATWDQLFGLPGVAVRDRLKTLVVDYFDALRDSLG